MDFVKLIAFFLIGMFIGGIILLLLLKTARKQFEDTIEFDDEWDENAS